MSDPAITRKLDGAKGRYELIVDGHTAELTYSVVSPTMIIADHTGVPDALRGRGVGKRLVERVVEDAKSEGFKITPLCPFVNAQRARNPEWAPYFSV